MRALWKRFAKWVQRWATVPARWREYQEILDEDLKIRKEFNGWAGHFGYLGWNYMEAACAIARRCAGAEEALKRLALSLEAEAEAAGLPGLTPAEIERLALLTQECGEMARSIGKILRSGWKGDGGLTTRVTLERGMGEMRAAVDMLLDAGDVRRGDVTHWYRERRDAGDKGMHHQPPQQRETGRQL